MSKHPLFMDSLFRYGWPKTHFKTGNNGPVSWLKNVQILAEIRSEVLQAGTFITWTS